MQTKINQRFEIRRLKLDEVGELTEMARTAFLQAFTEGNKPENVQAYLEEAFTKEQLEKEVQHPASQFWIASLGGNIVGYFKINEDPAQTDIHDPESLEIARLYVLEEFLGMGLGKRLLDKALEIAKQKQKKYLWLGVWEENARAIRFYQKNGLSVFGDHPFPFGDEIQRDFLMRISLE